MSTGADCMIYEAKPNVWGYKLQRWPYGEWEKYDTYGPFKTELEAEQHLTENHANPGGWSVHRLND